jgi:ABC-2 type transport system ATP-binding protein/lipopolysaccharide transport system ATP-binding protein
VGAPIILRGVSKSFVLRHNAVHDLKVRFLGLFHARHRETREVFWALRNVSLEVEPGETLGLIGLNGSGKSTLLRVIAGIFPPTTGSVQTTGRIATMIELGVGFHPELSGRENVYLNASLYGLTRPEIDAIYPDVVAFAELERFIDAPLKTYSSGMYMRLGFAVAAQLDPDILLVDEILTVGDELFQQKCLAKMAELRHKKNKTIVFVSHNLPQVEETCDRVALLQRSELVDIGPAGEVCALYRKLLS